MPFPPVSSFSGETGGRSALRSSATPRRMPVLRKAGLKSPALRSTGLAPDPVLGSRLSFARRAPPPPFSPPPPLYPRIIVGGINKDKNSARRGGVWELNRRPKVWKKNIVSSGASTITQKIKNLDLNIESKVN